MSVKESIFNILGSALEGNSSGNAPVMLMLGGFKFSLNTIAFQKLERSTAYRWPSQQRVGNEDAMQFTGPGEDRITIPGVIYPDFRGGLFQLDILRNVASRGRPLRLVSSAGAVLGLWVVESIDEVQSHFKPNGDPLRQEFNIRIRKFSSNANI